jgi:hypothetical protein
MHGYAGKAVVLDDVAEVSHLGTRIVCAPLRTEIDVLLGLTLFWDGVRRRQGQSST